MLCDVSGSVAGFSHFTLLLVQALREQFSRVRVFAFVERADEVTHLFEPGAEPAGVMSRVLREAELVAFDGHSDYGGAFGGFAEHWGDAVGPRSSLLVLGDARTNYRDPNLAVLRRLVGQARHAHWLNPEPRRQWGSGDSAALRYADVLPMHECRTAGPAGRRGRRRCCRSDPRTSMLEHLFEQAYWSAGWLGISPGNPPCSTAPRWSSTAVPGGAGMRSPTDAWVDHVPGWCRGADLLFAELLQNTPWTGREVRMYDRVVPEPRLTHRWHLDQGPDPVGAENRVTVFDQRLLHQPTSRSGSAARAA